MDKRLLIVPVFVVVLVILVTRRIERFPRGRHLQGNLRGQALRAMRLYVKRTHRGEDPYKAWAMTHPNEEEAQRLSGRKR
jgi:hypothetical protein